MLCILTFNELTDTHIGVLWFCLVIWQSVLYCGLLVFVFMTFDSVQNNEPINIWTNAAIYGSLRRIGTSLILLELQRGVGWCDCIGGRRGASFMVGPSPFSNFGESVKRIGWETYRYSSDPLGTWVVRLTSYRYYWCVLYHPFSTNQFFPRFKFWCQNRFGGPTL